MPAVPTQARADLPMLVADRGGGRPQRPKRACRRRGRVPRGPQRLQCPSQGQGSSSQLWLQWLAALVSPPAPHDHPSSTEAQSPVTALSVSGTCRLPRSRTFPGPSLCNDWWVQRREDLGTWLHAGSSGLPPSARGPVGWTGLRGACLGRSSFSLHTQSVHGSPRRQGPRALPPQKLRGQSGPRWGTLPQDLGSVCICGLVWAGPRSVLSQVTWHQDEVSQNYSEQLSFRAQPGRPSCIPLPCRSPGPGLLADTGRGYFACGHLGWRPSDG